METLLVGCYAQLDAGDRNEHALQRALEICGDAGDLERVRSVCGDMASHRDAVFLSRNVAVQAALLSAFGNAATWRAQSVWHRLHEHMRDKRGNRQLCGAMMRSYIVETRTWTAWCCSRSPRAKMRAI